MGGGGGLCIYLAVAVRCRSDTQPGKAKQHPQIAHTEVTLSGPPVICNNNSLSVPVDLWRADTMALHAPCFARSQARAFRSSLRTTKDVWKAISRSMSLRKCYLLIKKKRTEHELLSTFAPCVDTGTRSNLFNARTKHTQTHFSVCLLQPETRNKINQTRQNVQQLLTSQSAMWLYWLEFFTALSVLGLPTAHW